MWLNKSFRQKNPERSGTASSIPISLQLFISSIASFLSEGFFHAVESRNFTRAYFLGIKLQRYVQIVCFCSSLSIQKSDISQITSSYSCYDSFGLTDLAKPDIQKNTFCTAFLTVYFLFSILFFLMTQKFTDVARTSSIDKLQNVCGLNSNPRYSSETMVEHAYRLPCQPQKLWQAVEFWSLGFTFSFIQV